ncbi:MAG: hypothetical protein K9J25_03925 [Bacteroidales bacterium]|nr:hypothetical protein [Bacteroidales bacterium]
MRTLLAVSSLMLFIGACSNYSVDNDRTALAQVGDKLLYAEQIPVNKANGITREDSISMARNYIDRWIRNELILKKAEENLSEQYQNEINRKLEETRANLMIYQYEQQMMLQKMDTLVRDSAITNYYDKHLGNFSLQESIAKVLFLKLPVEAPNIEKARLWYKSDDQNNIKNLESYAYQFAEKFDDFGENWIRMSFLLRELPSDIGNVSNFLKSNSYYETSDSSFNYFVNIRDYRLKGSLAPIEYVRDDIKTIILNNRKIEFLQKVENGIYNEGMQNNSFKVFE